MPKLNAPTSMYTYDRMYLCYTRPHYILTCTYVQRLHRRFAQCLVLKSIRASLMHSFLLTHSLCAPWFSPNSLWSVLSGTLTLGPEDAAWRSGCLFHAFFPCGPLEMPRFQRALCNNIFKKESSSRIDQCALCCQPARFTSYSLLGWQSQARGSLVTAGSLRADTPFPYHS